MGHNDELQWTDERERTEVRVRPWGWGDWIHWILGLRGIPELRRQSSVGEGSHLSASLPSLFNCHV